MMTLTNGASRRRRLLLGDRRQLQDHRHHRSILTVCAACILVGISLSNHIQPSEAGTVSIAMNSKVHSTQGFGKRATFGILSSSRIRQCAEELSTNLLPDRIDEEKESTLNAVLTQMRGGATNAAARTGKRVALEEDDNEEEVDDDDEYDEEDEDTHSASIDEDDDNDDDEETVTAAQMLEDDDEVDEGLDPKLTAAAIASSVKAKSKLQADKVGKVKSAVNQKLGKISPQKKKKKKHKLPIPYILRATLNPFTAFSMVKAYWMSLFNLDYPPKDPSQELRSSVEAKNKAMGSTGPKPPKRKMKRGQAKTLSDLPKLSA